MIKTIQIPIKGMSCSSCSRSVERQVENLEGVVQKHVDHDADRGEFKIDESKLSIDELIATINRGHYKVDLPDGDNRASVEKEVPPCPVCHNPGADVPSTVFRSNLNPDVYKQTDLQDEFHICMTPECEVAYYSTIKNQLIKKESLKRELYFKDGSARQIICYCNNVDRQQIESSVKEQNLTGWEETMQLYSNKVQEKCEILNPTGLCCRELFVQVVEDIRVENKII